MVPVLGTTTAAVCTVAVAAGAGWTPALLVTWVSISSPGSPDLLAHLGQPIAKMTDDLLGTGIYTVGRFFPGGSCWQIFR